MLSNQICVEMSFQEIVDKYGYESPYQIQTWQLFRKTWANKHTNIINEVYEDGDDDDIYSEKNSREIIKKLSIEFEKNFGGTHGFELDIIANPIVTRLMSFNSKTKQVESKTIFDSKNNESDKEWVFNACKSWARALLKLDEFCNLRLERSKEKGFHYVWTKDTKYTKTTWFTLQMLFCSGAIAPSMCVPNEELSHLTTSSVAYEDIPWQSTDTYVVSNGFLYGVICFANHKCSSVLMFGMSGTSMMDILARTSLLKDFKTNIDKTKWMGFMKDWNNLDDNTKNALNFGRSTKKDILKEPFEVVNVVMENFETRFQAPHRDKAIKYFLESITKGPIMVSEGEKMTQIEKYRPESITLEIKKAQDDKGNPTIEVGSKDAFGKYIGKKGEEFFVDYSNGQCKSCSILEEKNERVECVELKAHMTPRNVSKVSDKIIIGPLRYQLSDRFKIQLKGLNVMSTQVPVEYYDVDDIKFTETCKEVKKIEVLSMPDVAWVRLSDTSCPIRKENPRLFVFHEPSAESISSLSKKILLHNSKTSEYRLLLSFDQCVMLEHPIFWSFVPDQHTSMNICDSERITQIYRITKKRTDIPIVTAEKSDAKFPIIENISYVNLLDFLMEIPKNTNASDLMERMVNFYISSFVALLKLDSAEDEEEEEEDSEQDSEEEEEEEEEEDSEEDNEEEEEEEPPTPRLNIYMSAFDLYVDKEFRKRVKRPELVGIIGMFAQYISMMKIRAKFEDKIESITIYVDNFDSSHSQIPTLELVVFLRLFFMENEKQTPMSDDHLFAEFMSYYKSMTNQPNLELNANAIWSGSIDEEINKKIEILTIEDESSEDSDVEYIGESVDNKRPPPNEDPNSKRKKTDGKRRLKWPYQ